MKMFRIAAGFIAMFALSGCLQDSAGEKAGSITRLSKDGWMPLCKTWEGEIIRGGLNNGSGAFGAAFHFTISGSLVDEVKKALETQKEVKIHYHHEKFILLGSCSSKSDGYFLDSIETIR